MLTVPGSPLTLSGSSSPAGTLSSIHRRTQHVRSVDDRGCRRAPHCTLHTAARAGKHWPGDALCLENIVTAPEGTVNIQDCSEESGSSSLARGLECPAQGSVCLLCPVRHPASLHRTSTVYACPAPSQDSLGNEDICFLFEFAHFSPLPETRFISAVCRQVHLAPE